MLDLHLANDAMTGGGGWGGGGREGLGETRSGSAVRTDGPVTVAS